ncbi:MAG: Cna protein B-type domain protein [Methanosaeta sp. PtaU1.Bin028]|nr:MAG: Cna protein B-type domain protein [Methanosaeta sp. PtaU1.Bin028]
MLYSKKLLGTLLITILVGLPIQAQGGQGTWPACSFSECGTNNLIVLQARIAGATGPTDELSAGEDPYLWFEVTIPSGGKTREAFFFYGMLNRVLGDNTIQQIGYKYDCTYRKTITDQWVCWADAGTYWFRTQNPISGFPWGYPSATLSPLTFAWDTLAPGHGPSATCPCPKSCNAYPDGQCWYGSVSITLFKASSIGDTVWHDSDADGVQEMGEPGLSDVTVKLYQVGAATPLLSTVTDSSGLYRFSNLMPGNYFVEFILPSGYVFSPKDQGGDDSKDSDADTTTGRTIDIALPSDTNDLKWDAGMYRHATIIITKNAVPDDPQDFVFTTNIAGYTTLPLDDDSDPTLPNTITIVNVVPGVYTVTEGSVASWLLDSITITEGTPADSTYSLNDRKAELHVSSYETVSVTFKNTRCQTVDAGDDQIVCGGVPIKLMGTAQYYSAVYWGIKQGIGSISYPYPDNKLQVIYTPPYSGESEAILVLTAEGACDPRTDEATVHVVEQPEAIIRRV